MWLSFTATAPSPTATWTSVRADSLERWPQSVSEPERHKRGIPEDSMAVKPWFGNETDWTSATPF